MKEWRWYGLLIMVSCRLAAAIMILYAIVKDDINKAIMAYFLLLISWWVLKAKEATDGR